MEPRKIVAIEELTRLLEPMRSAGKRIVFTNGCFDLLHVGHVRCLSRARALGDLLVVGLNSDGSVAKIKGGGRPLVPQGERAEVLAALRFVDYVVVFDEETPRELIAAIKPDVLVKGGDWKVEEVVGRDLVEAHGGNVVIVPFEGGHSTSDLVARIRRLPLAER